jgi:hypothetical protein
MNFYVPHLFSFYYRHRFFKLCLTIDLIKKLKNIICKSIRLHTFKTFVGDVDGQSKLN